MLKGKMCQKIYYMKWRDTQQNVKGEDVSENLLHEITAHPVIC